LPQVAGIFVCIPVLVFSYLVPDEASFGYVLFGDEFTLHVNPDQDYRKTCKLISGGNNTQIPE